MRMIKCNPQPIQVTKVEFCIYKGDVSFNFHDLVSIPRKEVYVPVTVSPDGKPNWQLKRIDNVWYWVKEN